MTDDGYRRNQENFGVLDFGPAGPMSTDALVSVTQFLDGFVTFASGPAVTRWRALTARATALAKAWTGPRAAVPVRIAPVLVGPGRPDAISQLTTLWPDNSPRTPLTCSVRSSTRVLRRARLPRRSGARFGREVRHR